MFPVDHQVNVHTSRGVESYTLLENQGNNRLVVLPAPALDELLPLLRDGVSAADRVVALLAGAVKVIDRRRGHELGRADALRTLAASRHPALRRAGLMRQPLTALATALSPEDLAWAFDLEAARRRLPHPD